DELAAMRAPPYPVGPDALFVAYYGSAELSCHLAYGWPMPARVLDLFAEFRCRTARLPLPHRSRLLPALPGPRLDARGAIEKGAVRRLLPRGGPWSADEQTAILSYCSEDVDALARLLPLMLPNIDLSRALLRGRYMAAAARIEWVGTPVDTATLGL